MELAFEGKITYIGDIEHVGQKETPKRTFVVEEITDRDYPASMAFDLWGDKTSIMDSYGANDTVKAFFNPRAREHNGRHYNGISAWKVEKVDGVATAPADDLPF